MKKIEKRIVNSVSAVILCIIAVAITAVCFLKGDVALKTDGKSYAPYYNGNRNSRKVAIMINVYEGSDVVKEMLAVLKDKGAKATFFVGGCWADDNGELLLKILEDGHELGSHGYFHRDHAKLNESQNREEMTATDNLIRRLTGYDVKLFAPPSGSYSATTLKVAESMGYKTIMWSKDTIDWRDKDIKTIINRATKDVCGGDMILMHPKKHTMEALPRILDYYEKGGLTAVTVSECIENGAG